MKTSVTKLTRALTSLRPAQELSMSYDEVNNVIVILNTKGDENEMVNFVELSKEEKLEVLNSMEIIEIDARGEDLIYALVENNEVNVSKIGKIVNNPEQVIEDWGSDEYSIDITRLAFENCQAEYFDGKKFTF